MDTTEHLRRAMTAEINADQSGRAELEARYGQCWSTDELTRDFDVIGFAAPCVLVRRKADSVEGTLMFRHSPRVYFEFVAR